MNIIEEEYLTDVLKKNNYVKKILSNVNGMTNFDRARNRIMYSQNLLDTYTISINKKQIKKNKNK